MSLHRALGTVQRRVRPRKERSDDEALYDDDSPFSGAESGAVEERSSSSDLETDQDVDIGSVSFGALAKAQSSIGISMDSPGSERRDVPHRQVQKTRRGQDGKDHTGEELPRKGQNEAFGRSSKHAPIELSSKKAVSRKRDAVVIPKRESRDPRFDPLTGPLDEGKVRKDYAFLEGYREIEMKSIRDEIRRAKDEAVKETLKRELLSMESKKKAQAAKDKQQDILNAHRKKEKELIKQGKKPFYLKKAEQKKMALMERYGKLKGKQLSRVIERKRKKRASREKKNLPSPRREVKS
ncbi:hypothetical protein GP486_000295 [Trichoglossum hirsutum]|uniref:rRNA biogenesis protein RRP36 n=1 Tax=Trichoglossum hirsutum TaxID=265104 RepID=A0A9P8LIZ9_9PEZI|nr:hypothetical protein GP486_000295 [Trichoglossum hirsutum]